MAFICMVVYSFQIISSSVLVNMLINKESKLFAAVLFVVHFNCLYIVATGKLCDNRYLNDKIRIDGKIVLITGGSSGLGYETARNLAGRGGKIYITSRNEERGEQAAIRIRKLTRNKSVYFKQLELGSISSIRKFSAMFHSLENRLDILINNAGTASVYNRTEDGLEVNMGVNYLGPFLLTNLLVDLLKNSAPSRVLVVTSIGFWLGVISRNNLNSERFFPGLIPSYCNTKLASILFTRQLAKRLENTGVTVNSLDPGLSMSEFSRNLPTSLRFAFAKIQEIFGRGPVHATQTYVMLAVDPSVKKISGKHFIDCIDRQLPGFARDDDTGRWLWDASVNLTKLSNDIYPF